MKKLLIICFIFLSTTLLFSNDKSASLSQFLGKDVVIWCSSLDGNDAYTDVKGKVISITDYGVIIESTKNIIFVSYNSLLTMKYKKSE